MGVKTVFFVMCVLAVWMERASSELEVNSLSTGLKKFASEFYLASTKSATENIVMSPYSVQTALLLLFMGAQESSKTAVELSSLFGLQSQTRDDIKAAYSTYHKAFSGSNSFKVANKIYAAKTYTLKPSFSDIATTVFGSEASTLDFVESVDASNEINTWVQKQTNDKIKNLFLPDEFNSNTRMVIANAIYFKGEWKEEFLSEDTKPRPFFNSEDESVDVPTMSSMQNFKVKYFSEYEMQAIELEYKDSDLSMVILLPFARTGLDNLERNLTYIDVFALTKDLKSEKVLLRLPKFKIETELDLTEVLKKMGVERMFTDVAEFHDIFEFEPAVTVNKAIHKAFIEIDEKGAEAVSATGVAVVAIRANPEVRVDHPFIYLIKNADTVLFMGSVKKF